MKITRTFLNERLPALPQAAAYLFKRYRRGSVADLQDTIIVVPGARARRPEEKQGAQHALDIATIQVPEQRKPIGDYVLNHPGHPTPRRKSTPVATSLNRFRTSQFGKRIVAALPLNHLRGWPLPFPILSTPGRRFVTAATPNHH